MKTIKVILNPVAGKGFSGRAEPRIREFLKDAGIGFDLIRTHERGHAIELAEQAVKDGFETVVAAGGDGTTNEVMNGLIAAYKGKIAGTLGLLPTGSASDFMGNVGVAKSLEEACHRLGKNQTRLVDLAVLRLPGEKIRYFDNQLGIGFDAVVTIEAQKFRRLRGMALYFPVVLKTVFLTNKATRVTIEADGQKMELPTMQISVANGSREGGGFYLAPEAKLDDGYLDLCVVRQISKLTMLRMIPTFMKGTHIKHKATTMLRARKVTITSEDDLIAHIDGEIVCTDGHRIDVEIIPRRLRVIF
jgi:diacylglycerol kinase (ATP)